MTVHERMKVTEEWLKYCNTANITVMVQIGGGPLRDVQELVRFYSFFHLFFTSKCF